MKDSPSKTICLINTNTGWGYREQWLFGAARELKKHGHHSFMVAHLYSDIAKKCIEEDLSVFAVFIHSMSVLNPFKVMAVTATIKQQKVDVIMLNLLADLKLAALVARLAGVKKIIICRDASEELKLPTLPKLLLKDIHLEITDNFEEIVKGLA
jgi:hypothetical protein